MPVIRSKAALVASLSAVLAVSACGGSSSSQGSTDPIVIGSIAQLSGNTGVFPDAGQAAKVVFDQVNSAGGIKGRKIEFKLVDDGGDAAKSAQVARRLVSQDKAVVLAASASAFDCFNGPFYVQNKIDSIVGVAILPTCFSSPNMAPVVAGPFVGLGVSLVFATQTLKKTSPCVIGPKDNGFQQGNEAAVSRFEKITGKKVTLAQYIPLTTDYGPYILKAKAAGCDVVVSQSPSNLTVAYEKQFNQAGARATMTSVQLSSAYSVQNGTALSSVADGMYANSEFLPFTGSAVADPGLADYKKAMEGADIPLNSFGQAGYLSATILVDVLKGISGPITRESVTKALTDMKPVSTPLMGNPYVFGPGSTHQANISSRFVQLRKGTWEPVTTEWTQLPE